MKILCCLKIVTHLWYYILMSELPAVGEYTVRIEEYVDESTGIECLREEWRDSRNYIHRIAGPAVKYISVETGKVFKEEWQRDYEYHRDNAPAIIEGKEGELNISETWYQYGQKHRDGAPAYLMKDNEGRMLQEAWYHEGMLNRADGPAYTLRDEDSFVAYQESHFKMGEFHNLDGPAHIQRNQTSGVICLEEWHLEGKLHRDNGPAIIKRDYVSGQVTEQRFYENGIETKPSKSEFSLASRFEP